jgi:hypothetical protein
VIGWPAGWVHSTWRSSEPDTSSSAEQAERRHARRWVSITRQPAQTRGQHADAVHADQRREAAQRRVLCA